MNDFYPNIMSWNTNIYVKHTFFGIEFWTVNLDWLIDLPLLKNDYLKHE